MIKHKLNSYYLQCLFYGTFGIENCKGNCCEN